MKLGARLAIALAMSTSTIALADDGVPGPDQDPYIWLEQARSPEALDWVAKENARTLAAFEREVDRGGFMAKSALFGL